MSVRYSGDTEIRLGFDHPKRVYRGTVVDPYLRFRGEVGIIARHRVDPTSPAAYDDAARRLVTLAERWAKQRKSGKRRFALDQKRGRTTLMRVFHAPCPLEDL